MMKPRFTMALAACLCALFSLQAGAPAKGGAANDYADEQGSVVQYAGRQYVRVSDARQFLRSFISGKNILVARQTVINLTPLLDDREWWTKNNPCFRWLDEDECAGLTGQNIVSEKVFDGRQLCIVGYHDITILGEGNSQIVVEPRYAFCLNFVNCSNITLRNLTVGHTDEGECMGGVIGVTGGSGISLQECNLYGCGTYGLQLADVGTFSMTRSGIHDCTEGIMTLDNVESASFQGCNFFRNGQYSLVDSRNSGLAFNDCRFYVNNPASILFNTDGEFSLSGSTVLHPWACLGTIDLARQEGNTFPDDPNDTSSLGDEPDPFIGAGIGAEKYLVIFSGAKPTIVDFITAVTGSGTGESDCEHWEKGWGRYLRTKKAGKGDKYTVDERNGYARIESANPGENEVAYHDFCYWNLPDGKHKLFAHSSGLLFGGKATETECTGLTFYLYDAEANVLTFLGVDGYVLDGRPSDSLSIAYELPRTGKDITFIDAEGRRGVLRWNGCGFGDSKIPMN